VVVPGFHANCVQGVADHPDVPMKPAKCPYITIPQASDHGTKQVQKFLHRDSVMMVALRSIDTNNRRQQPGMALTPSRQVVHKTSGDLESGERVLHEAEGHIQRVVALIFPHQGKKKKKKF